jgi:uncharacterized membrane protein YhaH (DUF805 family)
MSEAVVFILITLVWAAFMAVLVGLISLPIRRLRDRRRLPDTTDGTTP